MSKKALAVILAGLMAVSLAACASGTPTSSAASSTTSAATTTEATVAPSAAGTASPLTAKTSTGQDIVFPTQGFFKFDKPVTVNIGMAIDPTDKTLPDGDSADNNQYTRFLSSTFNIVVKAEWTAASGDDYNQKVSMAIASNSLPDAMVVNGRTNMLKSASSGELYDITDLWKQYASKTAVDLMNSTDGKAIDNASYNGKMVAIPSVTATSDGVHCLVIRQDWLDKLNLPVPKTVSDVATVAKAFLDNKLATIGIAGPDKSGMPYCNFLNSSNNAYGFDPIFQANDAWPGYWVTDASGQVSYGTLSAQTKTTLATLASWYKQGLIDPEIGVRDSSSEVVTSNQTGIFFGPWWAMAYGNMASLTNDPKANWQFYPIYTDDGKFYTHMKEIGPTYTLISKNASEDVAKAVIIMQNNYISYEGAFDNKVAITWYPLRNVVADMKGTEYEYNEDTNLLEGKTKIADYNDPSDNAKMGIFNGGQDMLDSLPGYTKGQAFGSIIPISAFDQSKKGFQRTYAIMVGDRVFSVYKPDKEVYSVTYSTTDTMVKRWANLQAMENEMVMKIITGKESIEYFDTFVTQWKAEGGDDITAEVQALSK